MQLVGLLFAVVPIALAILGVLCFLAGGLLSTAPRLRRVGFAIMLTPSMSLIGAAAGCFGLTSIAAATELGDSFFFVGWFGGLMLGAAVGLLLGCVATALVWRRFCPSQNSHEKSGDLASRCI
jgi:hypothetical protein